MGINISHVDHEMFRNNCIVAEVNRAITKQTNIVAKEISGKFLEISIYYLLIDYTVQYYTHCIVYTQISSVEVLCLWSTWCEPQLTDKRSLYNI